MDEVIPELDSNCHSETHRSHYRDVNRCQTNCDVTGTSRCLSGGPPLPENYELFESQHGVGDNV